MLKPRITIGKVSMQMPNSKNIKIDRSSVLGNPYYLRDESQRDRVCDQYSEHFDIEIRKDGPFRDEMLRIFFLLKDGHNVNLQCHCAPKRCHGETIKAFLQVHVDNL